ncbi:hypothetical protein Ais01nite_83280 [Asanoa ishikariensis]|uniref:CU044_5270 family protein n=1 Tax=Asanoa ishikariensis TaxID=137265 RepID=A0A1H3S9E4_9ACTN|nr:CU044_5270 family protein [Asanoa ishikariensis]GIF70293.1 hypothetical protein Ais01nite_83280 [Asanoa ishikariensis]SDZ34300.1 hypothetical protein SAMN05421684_4707 [Asanoa ishikariensis]
MNDVREELARLLPRPTERDLPSDRHRQLQELLMNHMSTSDRPRRFTRRRLVFLATGLAMAVAVAAVAATRPEGASSGERILLAAATTAERTPEGTGAYWHLKVVSSGDGTTWVSDLWTARDGRTWNRYRTSETASATPGTEPGQVIELTPANPYSLGGAKVTLEQLRALPTEPAALRTRIDELIAAADVRTSAGILTEDQRKRAVFESLVSLVSQLPAPPAVRAAAFRAFATYPNVESTGQGLLISFFPGEPPARLVIDPTTARVVRTNVIVLPDGGLMSAAEGAAFDLTAEWTDQPPR